MAFRRRFTTQEKIDFTVGTVIEWQNGSHWHRGVVTYAPNRDEEFGWWRIGIEHRGARTATIAPGQYVECRPGKVRPPGA